MTKAEFVVTFDRLCRGFKHEATPEQGAAWFQRLAHAHTNDWAEAVTTLLCATKFPYLDAVLKALEEAAKHRRVRALQCERKQAERLASEVSGGGALDARLFRAIVAIGARDQVRHFLALVEKNVRSRPLSPIEQERELARLRSEEVAYTEELSRLLPQLTEPDLAALLSRYREVVAA